MDMQSSAVLLQKLVEHSLLHTCDDPELTERACSQLLRYAARVVNSGVAETALRDDALVLDGIRRSLLQAGKRQDADRIVELHDRLARLGVRADTRSRFLRCASACSHSSDAAQQSMFTSGLPGLCASIQSPGFSLRAHAARGEAPRTEDNALQPVHNRMSSAAIPQEQSRMSRQCEGWTADSEVSEVALVRDVLYVCQGIDGKYIRYSPTAARGSGGYALDPTTGLPAAQQQLLLQLCELGWLFRQVKEAADKGALGQGGVMRQAFCGVLQQELRDYYRLMAILEAQSQQALPCATAEKRPSAPYLTLRRLGVWLGEPRSRLRLLALMAHSFTALEGGAIINGLSAFAKHGDPYARTLVARLLQAVFVPLLDMIRAWVFEGRLQQENTEFFVATQAPGGKEDIWQLSYTLRDEMRPPFISSQLAAEIMRAGKTINFLRECCNDTCFAVEASHGSIAAAATHLAYGQVAALETVMGEAVAGLDRHLLQTLFKRYALLQHCDALKRYMLLGQGDFTESLMDLIGSQLDKPAGELSEFALNSCLDAAVRASNAQYDAPDIVERLRVRLPRGSAFETGWDLFSLRYDVGDPLSTVLTPTSLAGYLRIFKLLWSLKRVEHRLSQTWQLLNSMQRQLRGLAALQRELGLECPGVAAVWAHLRNCLSLRSEMAHFCTNLQHYIMFEVLEGAWTEFNKKLKTLGNLDELISAHQHYIDTILRKALLDDATQLNTVDALQGSLRLGAKTGVQAKLRGLLQQMLHLHGPVARLQEALDAATQELRNRATNIRLSRTLGTWATTQADHPLRGIDEELLSGVSSVLAASLGAYNQHFHQFVALLPSQAHVDLRFLIFRLEYCSDLPSALGIGSAMVSPSPASPSSPR